MMRTHTRVGGVQTPGFAGVCIVHTGYTTKEALRTRRS